MAVLFDYHLFYKTPSARLPIQMAVLGMRLNYSWVKAIVFQPDAASGPFRRLPG